jgi:hypothetical protein
MMNVDLPDGTYPFMYERLPLSELAWVEAPPELEALLKSQAKASGVEVIRNAIVELTCKMPGNDLDVIFTVYWPLEQDRIHMLAPRHHRKGTA